MADIAGGLIVENPVAGGLTYVYSGPASLADIKPVSSGVNTNAVQNAGLYTFNTQITYSITWYHKRAWRAESSAYVTWDTTVVNDTYVGGGTIVPPTGVVLYTWDVSTSVDMSTINVSNITSSFTAYTSVMNQLVSVGAITGPINVTLPTSPTVGQLVMVKDAEGNAGSKSITVLGNGKNIDNSSNYIISYSWTSVTVVYNGTKWVTTT